MKKRKIVIVGMGSIGRRHANLLAERSDTDIAFCDPDQTMLERSRTEIGPYKAHSGFEQALASHPDIMILATPHHLHVDQTLMALNRNIHVLCEKPMSDSLASAKRLAREAPNYAATVGIGFHFHFHKGLLRLKELITNGFLGQIIHISCRVGSFITLANSTSRYQASMQGALLLDYAHQPDLIYWLQNQIPQRVYVSASLAGDMEFFSDPNILDMSLKFQGPFRSTIHLNYLQMPERHEYEIVGDKGWALLDANTGQLKLGNLYENTINIEHIMLDRDQMYRDEHQAFFDAIDGNRAVETSPQDGLISMAIIDAAMRSWKSRKPATLES
jgi:predicted dehydrogenase